MHNDIYILFQVMHKFVCIYSISSVLAYVFYVWGFRRKVNEYTLYDFY